MRYNEEQREAIINQLTGKTIQAVEYDEEAHYWVIQTESGEFCFRFMAEMAR